jgi:hypothetical protein
LATLPRVLRPRTNVLLGDDAFKEFRVPLLFMEMKVLEPYPRFSRYARWVALLVTTAGFLQLLVVHDDQIF